MPVCVNGNTQNGCLLFSVITIKIPWASNSLFSAHEEAFIGKSLMGETDPLNPDQIVEEKVGNIYRDGIEIHILIIPTTHEAEAGG